MKLRLTVPATRQLEKVLCYIDERSPQGAQRVRRRLLTVLRMLLEHPEAGIPIERKGMRRVLALPYPYAVIYRLGDDEIVIHSIRHTARRPNRP